jgi:hypothetical protein
VHRLISHHVVAHVDGQWTRRLSASVVTPKSFELQFLGRQALGALTLTLSDVQPTGPATRYLQHRVSRLKLLYDWFIHGPPPGAGADADDGFRWVAWDEAYTRRRFMFPDNLKLLHRLELLCRYLDARLFELYASGVVNDSHEERKTGAPAQEAEPPADPEVAAAANELGEAWTKVVGEQQPDVLDAALQDYERRVDRRAQRREAEQRAAAARQAQGNKLAAAAEQALKQMAEAEAKAAAEAAAAAAAAKAAAEAAAANAAAEAAAAEAAAEAAAAKAAAAPAEDADKRMGSTHPNPPPPKRPAMVAAAATVKRSSDAAPGAPAKKKRPNTTDPASTAPTAPTSAPAVPGGQEAPAEASPATAPAAPHAALATTPTAPSAPEPVALALTAYQALETRVATDKQQAPIQAPEPAGGPDATHVKVADAGFDSSAVRAALTVSAAVTVFFAGGCPRHVGSTTDDDAARRRRREWLCVGGSP